MGSEGTQPGFLQDVANLQQADAVVSDRSVTPEPSEAAMDDAVRMEQLAKGINPDTTDGQPEREQVSASLDKITWPSANSPDWSPPNPNQPQPRTPAFDQAALGKAAGEIFWSRDTNIQGAFDTVNLLGLRLGRTGELYVGSNPEKWPPGFSRLVVLMKQETSKGRSTPHAEARAKTLQRILPILRPPIGSDQFGSWNSSPVGAGAVDQTLRILRTSSSAPTAGSKIDSSIVGPDYGNDYQVKLHVVHHTCVQTALACGDMGATLGFISRANEFVPPVADSRSGQLNDPRLDAFAYFFDKKTATPSQFDLAYSGMSPEEQARADAATVTAVDQITSQFDDSNDQDKLLARRLAEIKKQAEARNLERSRAQYTRDYAANVIASPTAVEYMSSDYALEKLATNATSQEDLQQALEQRAQKIVDTQTANLITAELARRFYTPLGCAPGGTDLPSGFTLRLYISNPASAEAAVTDTIGERAGNNSVLTGDSFVDKVTNPVYTGKLEGATSLRDVVAFMSNPARYIDKLTSAITAGNKNQAHNREAIVRGLLATTQLLDVCSANPTIKQILQNTLGFPDSLLDGQQIAACYEQLMPVLADTYSNQGEDGETDEWRSLSILNEQLTIDRTMISQLVAARNSQLQTLSGDLRSRADELWQKKQAAAKPAAVTQNTGGGPSSTTTRYADIHHGQNRRAHLEVVVPPGAPSSRYMVDGVDTTGAPFPTPIVPERNSGGIDVDAMTWGTSSTVEGDKQEKTKGGILGKLGYVFTGQRSASVDTPSAKPNSRVSQSPASAMQW